MLTAVGMTDDCKADFISLKTHNDGHNSQWTRLYLAFSY